MKPEPVTMEQDLMAPQSTAPLVLRAPITRVTVFEDRADLVRTAEVSLPTGTIDIVIDDVSPLVSADHITVGLAPTAGGVAALIHDVRVSRTLQAADTEVPARRRELLALRNRLQTELEIAHETLARLTEQRALAEQALHRNLEGLAIHAGRGQGDAGQWAAARDALKAALVAADAARHSARVDADDKARALADLGELTGAETPPRMVTRIHVRAASAGGAHQLRVATVVPCAAWRPTHDARLHNGAVHWTTQAAVWQHTGEEWRNVDLLLSTARPQAGATLPRLQPDRLSLRLKSPEERKTIVVAARETAAHKAQSAGAAPGVDDGGQVRSFAVNGFTVKSDGRPHRAVLGGFVAPCTTARTAMPELSPHVFLKASMVNEGQEPLLAGGVNLSVDDTTMGTGDIGYVGPGERFDLSFGSDDRFVLTTETKQVIEKKLVGKDVTHFVRSVSITHSAQQAEQVTVVLRVPVSEVEQLKVVLSDAHCVPRLAPDADGFVRATLDIGQVRRPTRGGPPSAGRVTLGFHYETQGDVRVPDPW